MSTCGWILLVFQEVPLTMGGCFIGSLIIDQTLKHVIYLLSNVNHQKWNHLLAPIFIGVALRSVP